MIHTFTARPLARAAAAVVMALTLVAGCNKKESSEAKSDDSTASLAATILKERSESRVATKKCAEAIPGCRYDSTSDTKSMQSGEPYVAFFYKASVGLRSGNQVTPQDVRLYLSVTEFKSPADARKEATLDRHGLSFGRPVGKHVVYVSCSDDACSRVEERDALADALEKWLDGIAPL